MRFNIFLGGVAALAAAPCASARYAHDLPPLTEAYGVLEQRQATETTGLPPASTLSPDPWECITENITQYFEGPTPSGDVLFAINSYGGELVDSCMATAVEVEEILSCTVTDPELWCGFTTAAPESVLSSYAGYVTAVASFWSANSEKLSTLPASCPVAWKRYHLAQLGWLSIGKAHAECYLREHPETGTETTSTSDPSPTDPGSGVTTPVPIQDGMVDNCNKFHFVQTGETCGPIAELHSITWDQFMEWNPDAGSECTNLWTHYYACVGVIGHTPSPPSTSDPSPTDPGNGITTPEPFQDGMVDNCNQFHFVETGQTCGPIAELYSITWEQFMEWNPDAGSECINLWTHYYACVGVIGHTPSPPDPTQPPTGVTTPSPTQPGMVDDCQVFTYVNPGDTCESVALANGISVADFAQWNTGVGGVECLGLWADVYVCIGI